MNKLFIKISLYLVLILSVTGNSYSQEPALKTKSEKSRFFFDITYKNGDKKSKHLVKVGIRSKVYGEFRCNSGPTVLFPIADYIVKFHVSQKETIIDADPPVEIKSDEAARFTISYVPIAIGACGLWSSEVSGILIFDNGEKVYTDSERITREDVTRFSRRTPEESEILEALKHRDADLRVRALKQLSKSGLDKEAIEFILKNKLDDQKVSVRTEAAKVAAEMGFKSLAKKIALLLSNSQDGAEIAVYCTSLGRLKDADTIDTLVQALNNLKVDSFYPKKALLEFEHPDVIKKVKPLLLKNINWTSANAPDELSARYLDIFRIVVEYRDIESIPILSELIGKAANLKISRNIIAEIFFLTNENQEIKDPFVLAMRPALETAFKASDSEMRHYALRILCQMPLDESTLEEFLKNGFKDTDGNIRMLSAALTARLGYKSLVNEIILLLKSSKSESEKERYCKSLQALGQPC